MNNYQTLIKSKGKVVTFISGSTGTYDTTTRKVTGTTVTCNVIGYIFDNSDSQSNSNGFTKTFKKILLSTKRTNGLALPTPQVGDKIISDDTYHIVNVDIIKDKNVNMFYNCSLRG